MDNDRCLSGFAHQLWQLAGKIGIAALIPSVIRADSPVSLVFCAFDRLGGGQPTRLGFGERLYGGGLVPQ